MNIQLLPYIFERTGPETMLRLYMSRFATRKKTTKTNDEIGPTLVSGALDDTKTIGKAGADIFANFGAEKP